MPDRLRQGPSVVSIDVAFPGWRVGCRPPAPGQRVGERVTDIQERERGETTLELTRLGAAGLDTLDTLIMAGTAATRAEAIRWAQDRIRERPAYQRRRELRSEADKLKNEF